MKHDVNRLLFLIRENILNFLFHNSITALLQFAQSLPVMFGSDSGCMRGFALFLPVIAVWKADGFEQILGSGKLEPKPFFYNLMKDFFGDGLVTRLV